MERVGWKQRCGCECGKLRSERLASLDPPDQLCTLHPSPSQRLTRMDLMSGSHH